jgi:hypothetical protein
MATTLASIIFRMSHAEILARAESILKAMTLIIASLEPWSPFIPSLVQLQDVTQRFKETHEGAETGNFVKVAERNAIRPELNQVLTDMGDFMEVAARKDPTLLMKTCFDIRPAKKPTSATRAGLLAPESFSVKHGIELGMLVAKTNRVQRAKSYEIHVAFADPTVETNWGHHSTHGSCLSMEMRGFAPGKNVSLRARAIGAKITGPWSHFVTIMPI